MNYEAQTKDHMYNTESHTVAHSVFCQPYVYILISDDYDDDDVNKNKRHYPKQWVTTYLSVLQNPTEKWAFSFTNNQLQTWF